MMSDKKISDLVELTTLAADDVFPVVDADANATKRVTYDTLATEVRTEAEPLTATTVTASTINAGNFVGAVQFFAMDAPPTGWLKANGAEVSRSTYADLFSAIGTTFGSGDGSTTFDLPDLRGEFLRGWDNGRGVDSGRSFGSAQLDQMQRITGGANKNTGGGSGFLGATFGAFTGIHRATRFEFTGSSPSLFRAFNFDSADSPDARTSATTDGETRSRNIALLACIKY